MDSSEIMILRPRPRGRIEGERIVLSSTCRPPDRVSAVVVAAQGAGVVHMARTGVRAMIATAGRKLR